MLETNKKTKGKKMNKEKVKWVLDSEVTEVYPPKSTETKTILNQMDLHAMEIILIRNFMELSVLDCKVYARKYLEAFGGVAVSDLVNFYNKNIDRDKEETLATIGHDINLLHDKYIESCVPRTLK